MNTPMVLAHTSKADFFAHLDSFQNELFEKLYENYVDETFCKLLALKTANFWASDYHYLHRHSHLTAYPVQLLVDPANACQLQCPGCVHSSNPSWKALFDWEPGVLSLSQFNQFIDQVGLYAAVTSLYNYGEPLLNKRFPELVKAAKEYLLYTFTSSNLSLPLKNPEAIVASGLDRMVLSIDGASQKILERYRRRGNMAVIVENIKNIVAAKHKLGTEKPFLSWQFLTFEHNIHELDTALEMAEVLGVNEFYVATPYNVDDDDPNIKSINSPRQGRYVFKEISSPWCTPEERANIQQRKPQIDSAFAYSWEQRFIDQGSLEEPSCATANPPCQWLYNSLTMDALQRIMPCCIAPTLDRNDKHLVFAQFNTDSEVINSSDAVLARQAFADKTAYNQAIATRTDADEPYCAKCPAAPAPPQGFDMAGYMAVLDDQQVLPPVLYEQIRELSIFNA